MSDTMVRDATASGGGSASTGPSQDWKVAVYKAVGERLDAVAQANHADVQPTRDAPLPPVTLGGKGKAKGRMGKFLADQLFGAEADRRRDVEEATKAQAKRVEIANLCMEGRAAPMEIVGSSGRALRGNFFSASGHNLKTNGGTPDTTRPAVLLLTGSGGSAEFQGCDVAKFYADNGASVMSVNYGGFGNSQGGDGVPSEASMLQDSQDMLQHLVNLGYDPGQIIIHGFSLGGAVSAQLQEANENAGTKFLGAVLDRPMLSAVHGVEGHFSKAAHPVAALTRSKVAPFQGERAVKRLDGTTPMVITSDKGMFAERAEKLRKALKKGGRQVEGEKTGKDHLDSAAMVEKNGDALRRLIAGGGEPVQVSPDEPDPGALDLNTLISRFSNAASEIGNRSFKAQSDVVALKANPDEDAAKALLADVRAMQRELSAMKRYAKDNPSLAGVNMKITTFGKRIVTLRDDLWEMLQDAVPTGAEDVDELVTWAEEAMLRLEKAGGPSDANVTVEDEILERGKYARRMGLFGSDPPDTTPEQEEILDQLTDVVAAIKRRRAAIRSRAESFDGSGLIAALSASSDGGASGSSSGGEESSGRRGDAAESLDEKIKSLEALLASIGGDGADEGEEGSDEEWDPVADPKGKRKRTK